MSDGPATDADIDYNNGKNIEHQYLPIVDDGHGCYFPLTKVKLPVETQVFPRTADVLAQPLQTEIHELDLLNPNGPKFMEDMGERVWAELTKRRLYVDVILSPTLRNLCLHVHRTETTMSHPCCSKGLRTNRSVRATLWTWCSDSLVSTGLSMLLMLMQPDNLSATSRLFGSINDFLRFAALPLLPRLQDARQIWLSNLDNDFSLDFRPFFYSHLC